MVLGKYQYPISTQSALPGETGQATHQIASIDRSRSRERTTGVQVIIQAWQ